VAYGSHSTGTERALAAKQQNWPSCPVVLSDFGLAVGSFIWLTGNYGGRTLALGRRTMSSPPADPALDGGPLDEKSGSKLDDDQLLMKWSSGMPNEGELKLF
jgi:hypothetical protein